MYEAPEQVLEAKSFTSFAEQISARYNSERPETPYELFGILLTDTELVALLAVLETEHGVPVKV